MQWKDLEAMGVKRCCAMFSNGKRCRMRAVEKWQFSYCDKHGKTIDAMTKYHMAIIKGEARA